MALVAGQNRQGPMIDEYFPSANPFSPRIPSAVGEIGLAGLSLLHVEEGGVALIHVKHIVDDLVLRVAVHVEAQRAGEAVDLEAIVEVGRGGIGSLVEVRALSGDGEELEADVALVLEVGLAVELGAGRAQGARWWAGGPRSRGRASAWRPCGGPRWRFRAGRCPSPPSWGRR